ncbi:RAD55 family ATPase [Candidatus Bathyarchaeota archaeon]|nr:RAD55 family ATPase [Candidatus Bathyarchaeota archaeon]
MLRSGRQEEKIETCIPGFDDLTGGGLPKSSTLLIMGETDGCKEVLARQICWNVLMASGRVLYCTVDQPAEDVRQSMARGGWAVENHEKAGRLRFVDVYSSARGVSASRTGSDSGTPPMTDGFLARTAMTMFFNDGIGFFPHGGFSAAPQIAIIDSLTPLLSSNEVTLQLLNILRDATRIAKVTGIGTIHSDALAGKNEQIVRSYADSIIRLTMMRDDHSKGLIELVKYAGQYRKGPYPVKADEKGFEVLMG